MDNYAYIRTNQPYGVPPPTRYQGCVQHQCQLQQPMPYAQPQMQLAPATLASPTCGCSGAYHQNTVVVNQPSAAAAAGRGGAVVGVTPNLGKVEGRKWTSGMCGCFENCTSCICGFCFPPCFMCYLSDRLGEGCLGPTFCCRSFMVALRTKQRVSLGIKGTVCGDVLSMTFCPCCSATQMYREYKNTKV